MTEGAGFFLAVGLFFLACAQCGAAEDHSKARKYEACLRYVKSVDVCGKP